MQFYNYATKSVKSKEGDYVMLNYEIYQLKEDPSLHPIRFANTKFMNTHNLPIDAGNYDKVYSGVVDNESVAGKKSTNEVLESLYEKFNLRHPADFRGHSLSVSDVVTLHDNGVVTAHYCDSYGFTQIPEFVQPDAFVNLDSSGIAVSGHYGTWHTLESHNIQGQNFYLMESDEFGSDAANVIVDGTGKLVAEDVLTGFTPDIIQMITEEQQLAPHLTNVMQEEETQRRQAAEEYQEENYNCIDGNLFTQNKLTPGDDTLSQPEQIPDRATSAKDRSSIIGRLKAAQEKLSEKSAAPKTPPNKSDISLD